MCDGPYEVRLPGVRIPYTALYLGMVNVLLAHYFCRPPNLLGSMAALARRGNILAG